MSLHFDSLPDVSMGVINSQKSHPVYEENGVWDPCFKLQVAQLGYNIETLATGCFVVKKSIGIHGYTAL